MASGRRSGGEGATGEEGADAVGGAFRQVAQGLECLQEALRLEQQGAHRRLQEALRLQEERLQEALRLEREGNEQRLQEVVSGLQQQLQQKDAAICALQQCLDDLQGARNSEGPGGEGALPRLEGREDQVEASLQSAPEASLGTHRAKVSRGATAGAREAAHEEEEQRERERERVQQRVRETKRRLETSRAAPSPLGDSLCKAAKEGRVEEVERLLDSGGNVNHTQEKGYTPLICALVGTRNEAVVSLLLERGADANAVDLTGNSSLHFATRDHSDRCIELLVGAGADVNSRSGNGATPLHRASDAGNEAAVRALLAGGATILTGWHGVWENKTPLDAATTSAVRRLLGLRKRKRKRRDRSNLTAH